MLILSRKVGEEIVINGNITVVVNRVAGDRVTLAFKAPQSVRILRGELEPLDQPLSAASDEAPKPARPINRLSTLARPR